MMIKRATTTFTVLVLSYAVLGSVVFLGVPLSSRLLGQWRVVQVFGAEVNQSEHQLTIRFDKDGRVVGRSKCGAFTDQWTTGPDRLHIQGLKPSGCALTEQNAMERRLMEAMGQARETRVEKNGVMLMHQGRPVALLVPQQT